MKKTIIFFFILAGLTLVARAQDETFPPHDSTPSQIPALPKVKKEKKVKKICTDRYITYYFSLL
ncbi:MAG: hypothetical protein IPM95_15245 [Sphingobacteriales bacterium]|nr:hypothetical protein [Sphingobacteriales bacterium]